MRLTTVAPGTRCTNLFLIIFLKYFNLIILTHDMIAANGTIVDDNVPGPEGDRVPLLNLEAFLLARGGGAVNFHVRCHSKRKQKGLTFRFN